MRYFEPPKICPPSKLERSNCKHKAKNLEIFEILQNIITSGGTGVLYAKKRYIGHPLFYSKFGPYIIQI